MLRIITRMALTISIAALGITAGTLVSSAYDDTHQPGAGLPDSQLPLANRKYAFLPIRFDWFSGHQRNANLGGLFVIGAYLDLTPLRSPRRRAHWPSKNWWCDLPAAQALNDYLAPA